MKGWYILGILAVGCALTSFLIPTPSTEYMFPLKNHRSIAGTFGEPRNNHFHSGLDIKTGGRTGDPVYAIDDAFVYRIKVSPVGFGKAVYLRHADGKFSVYAHLSAFNKAIGERAWQHQQKSQRFAQEIYPKANEIRVKKGEVIGYVGNSGNSTGPHLHFEIRDPQERILDPMLFFPGEIEDNIPPIVQQLGIEPLDHESRVMDRFGKYIVQPLSNGTSWQLPHTIQINGRIGIEYRAYDRLNASRNHCGINHVQLFLDDKLIYEMDLWRFSFDETRYVNQHIDFRHLRQARQRFQKAYVDKGDKFSAYVALKRGVIELKDDQVHPFKLVFRDLNGNTTQVNGKLRRKRPGSKPTITSSSSSSPQVSHENRRNTLVVKVRKAPASYYKGITYTNRFGQQYPLLPEYARGQELTYLLPLYKQNYPYAISDKQGLLDLTFDYKDEIVQGKEKRLQVGEARLYFTWKSVFDRLHLQVQRLPKQTGMLSDIYQIGDPTIPLFSAYSVGFYPPKGKDPQHLAVAYKDRKKGWVFSGNRRGEGGLIFSNTRDFGQYCLMEDTQGPEVRPLNFNVNRNLRKLYRLTLRAKDHFSGIDHRKLYGTLDGEWILFEYDAKSDRIIHTFQERPNPGVHELNLKVYDQVGNLTQKTYTLIF